MKKEWQAPELKILDVNMTMASLKDGQYLDRTYEHGTPKDQVYWS